MSLVLSIPQDFDAQLEIGEFNEHRLETTFDQRTF